MDKQIFKADQEPKKVLFLSEPYVIYTKFGYQAVADVVVIKGKKELILHLGAKSLSERLNEISKDNNDKLTGIEVWIYKADDSKYAQYLVEL